VYYGAGHFSAWAWILMSVGMLVFWGGLIAAAVALFHRQSQTSRPENHSGTPTSTDPEKILATRFARGEIEEAEYRDRIAGLRGHMRT
jgi:putative membrane protein